MKTFVLTAGMTLCLCLSTQAAVLPSGIALHKGAAVCTRQASPVARVAALSGAASRCCDGQLGCAQFLSTITIARSPHDSRT